nr:hypothetical protein [Acinetobacter sp. ANC 4558]
MLVNSTTILNLFNHRSNLLSITLSVSFAFGVSAIHFGFTHWKTLFLFYLMYAGASHFLIVLNMRFTIFSRLFANQVSNLPYFLQALLDFLLVTVLLSFLLVSFDQTYNLVVIYIVISSAISCYFIDLSAAIFIGISNSRKNHNFF